MAKTTITEVQDLVQKVWAPLAMDELRAKMLLGSLVNREYEGQIRQKGDTVQVSVINKVAGERKTIGTDAMSFTPTALTTTKVDVKADTLFIASVEIDDIVDIQSQIDKQNPKLREAIVYGLMEQVNKHLYAAVAPQASHQIQSTASIGNSELLSVRTLAAKAKWAEGWYGLVSPTYYTDLLSATNIVSSDFVQDKPVQAGVIGSKRYGFNLFEDNGLGDDKAVFFHPDFLLYVMQTDVEFKISDKHANKELGYILSAHFYGGCKLGPEGAKKHIYVTSEATGFTPGV